MGNRKRWESWEYLEDIVGMEDVVFGCVCLWKMCENGGKVKEGKSGFGGVERTKGSGFGLGDW